MLLKKTHFQKGIGGILVLLSLTLILIEYNTIFNDGNTQRYTDYSILLFISRWSIYFVLLLAGLNTFFKAKSTNLFLLLFSLSALLEIYINENYYIIKSIDDFHAYLFLMLSVIALIIAVFNVLKTGQLKVISVVLSIILAGVIVYLPNALITYYF
ncbi:hypothetical protein [Flammeovirga aprica]|uniref:Uncharacterized protein n=1 Tax=Flammeovirga aprica JL-4 TaxID=694437 RepID=A0A7X9P2K3_9BACT|nr:hypothetical protein [Flammeovirga aprica]NME68008.1 hypothetical protein [Flammeovirga aprica JL-4]